MFFLSTNKAAVSASADSLRWSSFLTRFSSFSDSFSRRCEVASSWATPPLACMQLSCQDLTCSTYKPFLRQYSASSISGRVDVSTTIRYLSRVLHSSLCFSPEGAANPFPRISFRHNFKVPSGTPVSCRIELRDWLFGGNIFAMIVLFNSLGYLI